MDLLTACRLGGSGLDGTFVRSLLAGGADVNLRDDTAWTAMMWCTRNGAVEALAVLGEAGADVNAADSFNTTALHLAARDGRADACAVLLRFGAHVNARNEDLQTPLTLAARNGHEEVLLALGAAGTPAQSSAACVEERSRAEAAPAAPAAPEAAAPEPEGSSTLAEPGAEPEDPSAQAPVEHERCVLESLPPPHDPAGPLRVEEVDVQGQSALLWACLRNRPKAVRALLQLGARVDAADPKGRTGLMVAAELGAFECQELLLAGGAAVNAQARDGSTAILCAARAGRCDTLRGLLQAGAGATRPADRQGNTALSVSSEKVMKSLLDADPSRLFLADRNDWACFTACLSAMTRMGPASLFNWS
jgi:hypothetical protein